MTVLTGAEGLLPGILDDITFNVIVPKLSWKDVLILSSVSRDWLHAIQTRQVYQARVRSRSTNELVLFSYNTLEHGQAIALYSKIDNSFSVLPGIPNLPEERIPCRCQCISVEGKVYVLGGQKEIYHSTGVRESSGAVYVLDLAGQRQWKQCASMKQTRHQFACGVVDGKIYIFGGFCRTHNVCLSEMYDPKEDTWSSISPSLYFRASHRAESIGGELFLHSGGSFGRTPPDSVSTEKHVCRGYSFAYFLEVYNPVKDEWRVVEPIRRQRKTCFFQAVGGKFHVLIFRHGQLGIDIDDEEAELWMRRYSISRAVIVKEFESVEVVDVVVVDNEISALIVIYDRRDSLATQKNWYIRSRGFATKSKKIVWEKAQVLPGWYTGDFMCAVQA